MKRSKKYQEVSKKIDKDKAYPIAQAIKLVDGSIEIHVRLGVDPKKGDQQVRGAVTLPHGTGKTKTITAIVSSEKEKEAKDAGADVVGSEELIADIKKSGKVETDIVLATPDMMPKLAVVARILGPKGLMPSPKNETITTNIKKTIAELKKGKINFKNDDTANVHQVLGKVSFDDSQLSQNYQAFMAAIVKAKPSSTKGVYIKNISISASMSPGVKVEI